MIRNEIRVPPQDIKGIAGRLLPAGYRIGALRKEGRRHYLEARSAVETTSGSRVCMISDGGLWLNASRLKFSAPCTESVHGAGIIKFHVRLAGPSCIGRAGHEGTVIPEMSCGVLIHPEGEAKTESYNPSVEEQSVTVACTPRFLVEEFGLSDIRLPQDMVRFLRDENRPISECRLPMTLDIRRLAKVLHNDLFAGSQNALVVEGLALELLGRFVDQLAALEAGPTPAPILAHDRRIAEAARAVLEDRFVEPPSIAVLACEVGTHPAKLMRLFKAVQGCTVSTFVEALRMDRARQLLDEGELSVTQIAFEVGYEHSSNFATAFKRYFGVTPSSVRSGVIGHNGK